MVSPEPCPQNQISDLKVVVSKKDADPFEIV